MTIRDTNAKGEYALYDKGKFIGYAPTIIINGRRVVAKIASIVKAMQAEAIKTGITLRVNSGLRTFNEQVKLRMQNVRDKAKLGDEQFILTASSNEFSPATAIPGWSNHQDGTAIDFQTTNDKSTSENEEAFEWLKQHAIEFGFIRTVPSERWHWEYRPGQDMYSKVLKSHSSWN